MARIKDVQGRTALHWQGFFNTFFGMIHTFFGMILRGGFLVRIGPKARKSYLFWYDFVQKRGSDRGPGPEARIHTFLGMKRTKNRAEGPIFNTVR